MSSRNLRLLWVLMASVGGTDGPLEARESGNASPSSAERVGAGTVQPRAESGLEARQILQRAAARYPDMHAGAVAEFLRGPMRLSYTRSVRAPGELVVQHLLYTWPPERARLELKVLSGSGRDSISLLTAERGWLLVDGQRVEVNRRELQGRVGEYGLQSLLKLHLELPEQVALQFGASQVQYEGQQTDAAGRTLHMLRLEGGNGGARIVRVGIEAGSYLLRRAWYQSGGGVNEYVYDDFRVAFPSLLLPFRIELVRNGKVEDVVEIKRMEVLAQPPEPWLEVSDVRPPPRRGLINASTP